MQEKYSIAAYSKLNTLLIISLDIGKSNRNGTNMRGGNYLKLNSISIRKRHQKCMVYDVLQPMFSINENRLY